MATLWRFSGANKTGRPQIGEASKKSPAFHELRWRERRVQTRWDRKCRGLFHPPWRFDDFRRIRYSQNDSEWEDDAHGWYTMA